MQTPGNCVFCRLIAGEIEASVVHEDPRTVAFMDIQPLTPGHVLVAPRGHARLLADLNPDDVAQMIRVAQLAAAALRHSALQCEGVNVFLADGESAGQDYSTSTCMLFRGLMVTASVCGCRPTIGCGLATNWMSRHRRCGKPGLSGDIPERWRSPAHYGVAG